MVNKKLIALNMFVSYGRSLLTVGLTLFSTRWLLEALGKEDLGFYYMVGGVVVFLSFINTSMASSAQRNFAYALGHGGECELKSWFNSALSLHVAFALIFLVLSVPLGYVAFAYWFKLPDPRVSACAWVYVCSAITTIFSIITVPYNAIYIARQHIYELTIIQFLQSLCNFGLTWWLLTCPWDRLQSFAVGVVSIQFLVAVAQIIRCHCAFPECTIAFGEMVDKSRYRGLCYFSGLGLLSTFAYFMRGQGVAILLNNYGTSGVNAAYGIANNVSGQIGLLSKGFMNAVSPEITKLEGGGDRETMILLSNRSCKFSVLMILFLFVPLFTDIHPLLVLWLKNVPENTDAFVRIMFLAFLMTQSVLGVDVALGACGRRMIPLMVCSAISLLLALPIAYGFILFGFGSFSIVSSIAITVFLTSLNTLFFAHLIMDYPIRGWIEDVLMRNGIVAMFCFALNYVVHFIMPKTLLRLVAVGVMDALVICLMGWLVVLNAGEREFALKALRKVLEKFKR